MGDEKLSYRPFKLGELNEERSIRRGPARPEGEESFRQIYGPRVAAVAERLKAEARLAEQVAQAQAEEEALQLPDPEEIIREAVSRATVEIEILKAEARKEGYDAGLAEGRAHLEESAQSLVDTARDMGRFRFDMIEETRSQLVELVCEVSQRILGPLTEMQRECVVTVVTRALSILTERDAVTIRVNPEDLQLVLDAKGSILSNVDGVRNLTFVDDPSVARGGCLVETESTAIDARMKTQLDEIVRAVRQAK